jgi:D-lactate dehydrogenase (cytochrome)
MAAALNSAGLPALSPDDPLLARLAAIAGADAVTADPAELDLLAHDIAGRSAHAPALSVRPPDISAAQDVVREAIGAGRAVLPRGGGMSYTGGYQPIAAGGVLVDMRGIARIGAIEPADGYVVVEAGCTWGALHAALAERGLRTPFFGPLSGIAATIGGTLSQHGAFFGSGEYGSAADSVLGLEVILPDGSLLRTGAWAAEGRAPFHRAYGPDLTGLFLGDCGAFGLKARAVLKVIAMPASAYASFALPDAGAMAEAQLALAGLRGLAECYGFDPVANDNLKRAGFTLREKAEALRDVAAAGGGGLRGLAAAVGLGARRMAFLSEVRYSLHLVADGPTEADAEETLQRARAILATHGAVEIADSIPRATRAKPFRPIKALLGPEGELWLPVHGVLPASRTREGLDAVERVLVAHRDELERHGIRVTTLTALCGRAMIIEPQFFWRDALTPFHLHHVTPQQRDAHAGQKADPEARALVHRLRRTLAEALDAAGGTHFQLGKYYGFLGGLAPEAAHALSGIKRLLDPASLMNPGALGLAPGDDTPSR